MIRFLQTEGPTKKIILSGLLLIICAAMVITLIPGGLGSDLTGAPGKGVVAKVSGEDITADQVRDEAKQMAQQQAQQYGGANASMLMPFLIQQATPRAADQLIDRQALLAEAQHMGLKASPQEIKDELQHGRYAMYFFPGGNFVGETEYEGMLQRANLTPAIFENTVVAREIVIGKLQALITGGASVSDAAIRKEFDKQNTKVKFDYAVLKQEDIQKGLHPTEQELKAFYDSHQKNYANSIPEKRKVKYATIAPGKVQVQVTREDLQAYYDAHRDQYRLPEQVKVSHIWVKMPLPGTDGKIDDKAATEAQKRADDLLKQLQGGAKFDDVAKKSSEDPGSSNVGGSLGWISKGQMGPEFEKAVSSLGKGKVSGVVKTLDGFHIIRLDDKQDAHMKTLDEVKAEIEPIVKQQKGQQAAQKVAEDLLQAAKTRGLDAAAAAKGITVVTSDFFGRKDLVPGLGPAPQFMDAVFTAGEKSPPEMASTSQGFAVFQLLAVKPQSTPTFDEIRTKVEEQFKNERSNILLSQKTQELSDRAKTEHDLKKAAKELGATVKASDFVLPDGQVPDIGSMAGQASAVFGMKPGDISSPINSGANGVVISLLEVQAPSDADFVAKRDQIRDTLLQGKEQELFGLFVTSLREQMEKSGKIKINQDELKSLTRAGSEPGA